MENGLFGGRIYANSNKTLELLMKESQTEIMSYTLEAGVPIAFSRDLEGLYTDKYMFIFIMEGSLKIVSDEGVSFFQKNDYIYFSRLTNHIRIIPETQTTLLFITNNETYDLFSKRVNKLNSLVNEIKEKDDTTNEHLHRVSTLCRLMAQKLGFEQKAITDLKFAAYFHDLGKIKIPDNILKKVSKLSSEEFEIIKTHVNHSISLFSEAYPDGIEHGIDINHIKIIISQHHERLDGSGYPNGLKGNEICIEARILAIVDSFDAMVSCRPYAIAKHRNEAIDELKKRSNELDTTLVDLLDEVSKQDSMM